MDSAASEVREVIDSGWYGIVGCIRQLTQCMLHLVDDIRANQSGSLDMQQCGQLGIFKLDSYDYAIDALAALVDYEPLQSKPTTTRNDVGFLCGTSSFSPLEDADFKLVCTNISSKWNMLFQATDALLKPGMPEPSLDEIGLIFIEAARHFGVSDLVRVAAETELEGLSDIKGTEDLFGVGREIAAFTNGFLPPYATGAEATVSIPEEPDLDTVIAAYLSIRLTKDLFGHAFIPRGNQFDPRSTNMKKHLTIACGETPFNDPDRLCFDHRDVEGSDNNTELVVHSLRESGVAMNYADELVQWSVQGADFPSRLFAKFRSIAGTLPLAMNAWRMYLDARFPIPYQEPTPERMSRMTDVLRELEEQHPLGEQLASSE